MYDYFGEAAGNRIIHMGAGVAQVGDPYNLQVRTWPYRPAGAQGQATFRNLVAVLRHVNGYNIRVTPVVDDVARSPTTFSGGPPSGGATEQVVRCLAWIQLPGNRIEAIVETLTLLGETELIDILCSAVPIRVAE